MTTTIELRNHINITGGPRGAERIEVLEVLDLKAGHLWDTPAGDLGAKHSLLIGCRMAGFTGKQCDKLAQELGAKDMRALTAAVNSDMEQFQEGAEHATRVDIDFDEPHTIELRDPIKLAGDDLAELVLRPIKGKDVWDVPASGVAFGHVFGVGASQCGQADTVIKKLSAWDAGQIVGVTNAFLADFRETGE